MRTNIKRALGASIISGALLVAASGAASADSLLHVGVDLGDVLGTDDGGVHAKVDLGNDNATSASSGSSSSSGSSGSKGRLADVKVRLGSGDGSTSTSTGSSSGGSTGTRKSHRTMIVARVGDAAKVKVDLGEVGDPAANPAGGHSFDATPLENGGTASSVRPLLSVLIGSIGGTDGMTSGLTGGTSGGVSAGVSGGASGTTSGGVTGGDVGDGTLGDLVDSVLGVGNSGAGTGSSTGSSIGSGIGSGTLGSGTTGNGSILGGNLLGGSLLGGNLLSDDTGLPVIGDPNTSATAVALDTGLDLGAAISLNLNSLGYILDGFLGDGVLSSGGNDGTSTGSGTGTGTGSGAGTGAGAGTGTGTGTGNGSGSGTTAGNGTGSGNGPLSGLLGDHNGSHNGSTSGNHHGTATKVCRIVTTSAVTPVNAGFGSTGWLDLVAVGFAGASLTMLTQAARRQPTA